MNDIPVEALIAGLSSRIGELTTENVALKVRIAQLEAFLSGVSIGSPVAGAEPPEGDG